MQFFNLHTHKFTNQPEVLELVNQYPQEFDDSIPFYSVDDYTPDPSLRARLAPWEQSVYAQISIFHVELAVSQE